MAGERILIVDDESAVCAVVASMLERSGYCVETADGAEGALRIMRQHPSFSPMS